MKTFGFVVEVVINDDQDKTFLVRMPNGNVLGIFQSVGTVAECLDHFTDLVPALDSADK